MKEVHWSSLTFNLGLLSGRRWSGPVREGLEAARAFIIECTEMNSLLRFIKAKGLRERGRESLSLLQAALQPLQLEVGGWGRLHRDCVDW